MAEPSSTTRSEPRAVWHAHDGWHHHNDPDHPEADHVHGGHEVIGRLRRALEVAAHSPHDQDGPTDEASGFPTCSGCGAILTAAAPPPPAPLLDVDDLAQIIREVDGNHDLGAGALAEAIVARLTASTEPSE